MHLRVNMTLPAETVRLIERAARKGNRSRFVDHAVRHYVETVGKATLKKLLREGATRRSGRDARLAEEWFTLEEPAWPKKRA